ncbi:MAG: peroxiredoxin-like family protein [Vicingaceae bacterium]|nr:peroxiredoxin-like family protein [Vicingaceae bacterium]
MKNVLFVFLLIPSLLLSQEDNKALLKKGVNTEKYIPKGVNTGSDAPLIKGNSIKGEEVNSKTILQEKEIVVIFYRGEWCPICNRYLSNLSDSLSYIISKNAEVLVVGPETFENAEKTSEKAEAAFTIISDTTMQIQKDFDVLFYVTKKYQRKIKTFLFTDIAENNSQEEAQLPVPATYIIGRDGKIKWRHFDYDYSRRASVKSIIDNLD